MGQNKQYMSVFFLAINKYIILNNLFEIYSFLNSSQHIKIILNWKIL